MTRQELKDIINECLDEEYIENNNTLTENDIINFINLREEVEYLANNDYLNEGKNIDNVKNGMSSIKEAFKIIKEANKELKETKDYNKFINKIKYSNTKLLNAKKEIQSNSDKSSIITASYITLLYNFSRLFISLDFIDVLWHHDIKRIPTIHNPKKEIQLMKSQINKSRTSDGIKFKLTPAEGLFQILKVIGMAGNIKNIINCVTKVADSYKDKNKDNDVTNVICKWIDNTIAINKIIIDQANKNKNKSTNESYEIDEDTIIELL